MVTTDTCRRCGGTGRVMFTGCEMAAPCPVCHWPDYQAAVDAEQARRCEAHADAIQAEAAR